MFQRYGVARPPRRLPGTVAILLGVVTFWVFGLIGRKVVGSWADTAM